MFAPGSIQRDDAVTHSTNDNVRKAQLQNASVNGNM